MPDTNITASGATVADVLVALGHTCPGAGPAVAEIASAGLQAYIDENEHLAKQVQELEDVREELEEGIEKRDATLTAIANLISAVPDDLLPAAVNAELERRAQRITMLEENVRRLGAQVVTGIPPAPTFKAGDLVTVTWPGGESAPGSVQGDDPETGRYSVKYYDLPPNGGSGEVWAEVSWLSPRSGIEPGDPQPDKPKKKRRTKAEIEAEKAGGAAMAEAQEEQKWPAGMVIAEYVAWEAQQKADGVIENLNPQEFKRLCDAGLINRAKLQAIVAEAAEVPVPYDLPDAAAVTPEGKWAKDLDPAKGEKRPAPGEPQFVVSGAKPNPSAPPEIQEATRIIHEFDQLPDPVLEEGAKVAVLMKEPTAIAVGHIEQSWPGATMFRVKMLGGLTDVIHRDRLRGIAPDGDETEEPDAPPAEQPDADTTTTAKAPPAIEEDEPSDEPSDEAGADQDEFVINF